MNWQDSQESIMQIAACKCQFIARKLLKSNKLLPPWSYEFYDLHIMLWIVWNSIWHVWFCVTVDSSKKRKYLNQFLGNIYFINWLTVCILHFKLFGQKTNCKKLLRSLFGCIQTVMWCVTLTRHAILCNDDKKASRVCRLHFSYALFSDV